jgi:2-phosphosulfolactate phosphatase
MMPLHAPTVVIDCFPASAARYGGECAIVAVDVIRATTLAITAVSTGRRCLVAASLEDAVALRDRLGNALLVGELGGNMPHGFDMNNSPADLVARDDIECPVVMLSSSGTELMLAAGRATQSAYAACFRNLSATARHLIGRHRRVALIGAGSRGEFREEDQLGCSRIAELLLQAGYRTENGATADVIERWRDLATKAIEGSNSVAYLRRTNQVSDLEFTLDHVDDLDLVCTIDGNEIRRIRGGLSE